MNSETKRHIDAARQVLVGVVPNPTSQIDQITNALIYKFMDDMDQSAIKAGGKPSFFVGELEKYAWTRLMDSRIGNQERMNIYVEALLKFSESELLPDLFRNIFKAAFLPYRSPEVLGLFLKEINYFDYSHSEELGNAYEYLLSIMSSQGDAGQFRTPRHIIDFMVEVVDPKEDDKVLDPACGTAGFLISAYKHILKKHDGLNPDGSKNKEKPLTPDERKKLVNNFEGYDIDPGMVRIAQVNMYLHQFKNPKIYNYDTLTMEDRWNDKFDVILANPPFMSPKGGVQTHNKFSVQSNRSEVLFVDYFMNHLRPKGRAGIIVPEGIIFQSGNVYKQLRKNLVEDGLYAVVSLPSGVFAPYSGVKTSILLFNEDLSKQKTEILFVKIEQDGFNLGATKRPISKNDLPQALETLNKWRDGEKVENKLATYVRKSRIAENGDYNLSGDRYHAAKDYAKAKWPMVELGKVCTVLNGYAFKSDKFNDQKIGIPIIRIRDVNTGFSETYYNGEYDDKYIVNDGDLLIGMDGDFVATLWKYGRALLNQRVCRLEKFKNVNKKYIYYLIQKELIVIQEATYAVTVKHISSLQIERIKIPLPPLEIQEQIVAEVDGYAGIIAGAKQIAQTWKPIIDVDPEWEKMKIESLTTLVRGSSPRPQGDSRYYGGTVPRLMVSDVTRDGMYTTPRTDFLTSEGAKLSRPMEKGEVVMAVSGNPGLPSILSIDACIHDGFVGFRDLSPKVLPEFLYYVFLYQKEFNTLQSVGAVFKNLTTDQIKQFEIPLPPIAVQKQIVEKIEAERTLVESAKKLIEIYEQKTRDTIAKLWSK
jgi:type I restriction enzyme M protein